MIYFFFNDTATTEIYTLSLHDALPILEGLSSSQRVDGPKARSAAGGHRARTGSRLGRHRAHEDRKSTRLNSSHANISYAVFCLKKNIHISDHKYRPFSRASECTMLILH